MNDQIIDVALFAGVALFFAFQLWRVLGRRPDEERPPQMPPSVQRQNATRAAVTPLPRPAAAPVVLPSTPVPVDPVQAGLEQIAKADPSFQPAEFVTGARHAFEIIVQAFARGDIETLRTLVGTNLLAAGFEPPIQERIGAQQTAEATIERQEEPQIVEARLDGRMALVTVKFLTDQITVTRAADGSIVDGDPERAAEHTDIWTFARDTRDRNPNWRLVAIGEPA